MTLVENNPHSTPAEINGLKRAFARRVSMGEDEQADELITDIMLCAADANGLSIEALIEKKLLFGDIAGELLELLHNSAKQNKLPKATRELWRYVVDAWLLASPEEEGRYATSLRRACLSSKQELDSLRAYLEKALDGIGSNFDYTDGIKKVSRLLVNPDEELMGGDLFQILGRWLGHRLPAATTRLIASVLRSMPSYDIKDGHIPWLMMPALSAYAETLGRTALSAADLRRYIPHRRGLVIGDVNVVGPDKITFPVTYPGVVADDTKADKVLVEYARAVEAWREENPDAPRFVAELVYEMPDFKKTIEV